MDNIEYSPESIEAEDLRIFADKAMECLQSNVDKLWECLQSSTEKKSANPNSVQLMALVQGGGLHYAVTHGYAKRYLDSEKNGLKDVDIYAFFKRETGKESYKIRGNDDESDILRGTLDQGKYKGRRIDVLPYSIREFNDIADPIDAVKQWLERGWNIIKEVKNYDIETIKKATEEWNSKVQQNGVEKEYHPQFLAFKAVIVIYPKIILKPIWINPELKK
jgi:hypothetical protein